MNSHNTTAWPKLDFSLASNKSDSMNHTTLPTSQSTNKLMVAIITTFAVMTIILNGLILTAFIKHPNLRTPFNVYVISLACVDLISAVSPPTNIVKMLVGQWQLSGPTCSFVLFVGQMFPGCNRVTHLLIAVNRVWAVSFPHSYRNQHTKRLATLVILYSCALAVCLLAVRVVIARTNTKYSCALDPSAYPAYQMFFTMFIYDIPEVIILLAYPWLAFKLRRKLPNRVRNLALNSIPLHSQLNSNTSATAKGPSAGLPPMETDEIHDFRSAEGAEAQVRSGQSGKRSSESAIFAQPPPMSGTADEEIPRETRSNKYKSSSRPNNHNRLFAYLALSVICCWTPNHVFFLWSGITGLWSEQLFTVQFYLVYVNSWLNPILIYLANLKIRKAVNDSVQCR